MSNLDGLAAPLPPNDQTWENWVHAILLAKYPSQANAYGGRGYKQKGIDFVFYDGADRVGVQCKFVAIGSQLNLDTVEQDLQQSFTIDPPLARFELYTTAPSDPKIIDRLDRLKPIAQARGCRFEYLLRRDFEEDVRRFNLFGRLHGTLPPPDDAALGIQAASRPPAESDRPAERTHMGVVRASATLYGPLLEAVKQRLAEGDTTSAMVLVDAVLQNASQLSDSELAKAYANKAILTSRLGEHQQAAGYWRKSAQIEPDPDQRHGRLSQAYLCEDRYPEALEAARPGLDTQPPSALAAIAALSAGQQLGRRLEIDGLLSGRLKLERDVALVRAHVALADNDVALAKTVAAELAAEHPDDADVWVLQAEVLMREATGPRGVIVAHTGAEQRQLRGAVELYLRALMQLRPLNDKAGWLPAALNCIGALKLLGRHREAADLAGRVLDAGISGPEDQRRLVTALAEGGRAERALELTREIPTLSYGLVVARAAALLNVKRFDEAARLLAAHSPPPEPTEDVQNHSWMLYVARAHGEAPVDFEGLTRAFYSEATNKLSACWRIVETASALDQESQVEQYTARAIELFEAAPDADYLLFVVDAMFQAERWEQALALLLQSCDPDHPEGGPLEERLAYVLLRFRRFETLGKMLGRLPAEVAATPRFDPYHVDYHLARQDYGEALQSVRAALTRAPDNLKFKSIEIALLRETGDAPAALAALKACPFRSDCPLTAVSLIVSQAQKLGEYTLAQELAYRWIRANSKESRNVAWFIEFVLLERSPAPLEAAPKIVNHRCGVCLRPADTDAPRRWLVIDDRYPADPDAGWLSPSSPNATELIGKVAGETIRLKGYVDNPFIIEAITDVFGGAFGLINSRYGRDLPMQPFVQAFTVQKKDGKVDLGPLLSTLDSLHSLSSRAMEAYRNFPVPLGAVAQHLGRSPIDLWCRLASSREMIQVCGGNHATLAAQARRVGVEKPDVVIDIVTLVGLAYCEQLAAFRSSVGAIAMTGSALHILQAEHTRLRVMNTPALHMASDGAGSYSRMPISAEACEQQGNVLGDLLAWIELHVQVLPVPPTGLSEDDYSGLSGYWPAYIVDALQLSAHLKRLLIVDDRGIERMATMVRVKQSTSLGLLRASRDLGWIDLRMHAEAVRAFCQANYQFVSLTTEDFFALTDHHDWEPSAGVETMIRYLRIPSLNVESGISVLLGYLEACIVIKCIPHQFRAIVLLSLSALTRDGCRDVGAVVSAFWRRAENWKSSRYRRLVHVACIEWMEGHWLRPEEVAIDLPHGQR